MIEINDIKKYKDYIENKTIRYTIYKVDFLRKEDESIMFSFDGNLIDATGSVTNSLNEGIRRTCSISLTNIDKTYGKLIENLSIGNKFKLYMGYLTEDGPIYFSYGVYVMDNPAVISGIGDKTITLNGSDKWSMLNGTNGGILQGTYMVTADSNVRDVIRSILLLEITLDPLEPSIYGVTVPNGSYYWDVPNLELAKTPYDIIKDAGGFLSDIILEVLFSVNAYCYYNEDGRLIIKEFEYDFVKSSIHDFVTGMERYEDNDINYISSQKSYDYDNICNAVAVIADNMQSSGLPIVAYAYNNNFDDPNNILSLGYTKYKVITDYTKGINTSSLAAERALYELKKTSSRQSVVTITCLPLYHLDVNNITTMTDAYINSESERLLINTITTTISADGAVMTVEAVKASGYL